MSSLSRSNIRRISPLRKEGGSMSESNIPTAGDSARFDTAKNTLERGLLESRRRQVLGAAPAAGGEIRRIADLPDGYVSGGSAPKSSPALSPEQSRVKFYADQQAKRVDQVSGRNEVLGARTSTGGNMTTRVGDAEMGGRANLTRGTYVPESRGSTRGTYTPPAGYNAHAGIPSPPTLSRPREGRIDGMPAGEALAGMRAEAAAGGPRQEYGAEIAKRNVASMGVNEAVADYFQRNRLDAERPQRAAAAQADAMIPGNRNTPVREERNPLDYAGPGSQAMAESRSNPNVPYKAPDATLIRANAAAAGAGVLRTPERVNPLDFRTALRSPDTQAAVRGEVPRPSLVRPTPATAKRSDSALYSLGRNIRNAPAAVVGAVDSTGDFAAETIGRVGLNAGRAIKRGASNFGAGFLRQ